MSVKSYPQLVQYNFYFEACDVRDRVRVRKRKRKHTNTHTHTTSGRPFKQILIITHTAGSVEIVYSRYQGARRKYSTTMVLAIYKVIGFV